MRHPMAKRFELNIVKKTESSTRLLCLNWESHHYYYSFIDDQNLSKSKIESIANYCWKKSKEKKQRNNLEIFLSFALKKRNGKNSVMLQMIHPESIQQRRKSMMKLTCSLSQTERFVVTRLSIKYWTLDFDFISIIFHY